MSNIKSTLTNSVSSIGRRLAPLAVMCAMIFAMAGQWSIGTPALAEPRANIASVTAVAKGGDELDDAKATKPTRRAGKELSGKLNLNTANEEQLQMLPTVGPAKADRVVAWRKKNGGFKRIADLRRVKGFGYKTLKRLEPFLDIKGDTTLTEK
jgi:competence ComEA-like helix-hairpin-helix protein